MILIGILVHEASIQFLGQLLERWSQWQTDCDFFVILNGKLSPSLVYQMRELPSRYRNLSLRTTIQATGHLNHYGPLRHAQEFLRRFALDRNYTHLLFNEVTRLPEHGCLEALLAASKPVTGALYKDTYYPGYYCVYDFQPRTGRLVFSEYLQIDNITIPTRVSAMGFGFTLIERQVLSILKFRSNFYAPDAYFFLDLARLGIPAYVCPVFVKNVKIDHQPHALAKWLECRQKLLGQAET